MIKPPYIDPLAWISAASQAQRGRRVPLDSTCPSVGAWAAMCLGFPSGGRVVQLLKVPYPSPTPCTVQVALTFNNLGLVANSVAPKYYGWPNLNFGGGTPPDYETNLGTVLVEWLVGGAAFSAAFDLGANGISIPACDQVTVSYFSFVDPLPEGATVNCAVLPIAMPGLVATLTRVPQTVNPAADEVFLFRQGWCRRWKATASAAGPLVLPVPIGPVVVSVIDSLNLALSAEQVSFADFTASGGISAVNQGWIEAAGPCMGYAAANLGAVPVVVKLVEQVMVC
jgi:hypothetical protein